MKLIIDISKEMYNRIDKIQNGSIGAKQVLEAVINGTPIPDNATNGEVLKTMFKPNRITRTDDTVHIDYDFTPEWWNSPYQKGGKE